MRAFIFQMSDYPKIVKQLRSLLHKFKRSNKAYERVVEEQASQLEEKDRLIASLTAQVEQLNLSIDEMKKDLVQAYNEFEEDILALPGDQDPSIICGVCLESVDFATSDYCTNAACKTLVCTPCGMKWEDSIARHNQHHPFNPRDLSCPFCRAPFSVLI